MSNTGGFLNAETTVQMVEGVAVFQTHYWLIPPAGNHTDGVVAVAVAGTTESTFNLTVQQAVADRANLESGNVENYTAGDVFGGRI